MKKRWSKLFEVSDETFAEIVALSTSQRSVAETCGLPRNGSSFYLVRTRIDVLGLDTEHFIAGNKLPKEMNQLLPENVLIPNSPFRSTRARIVFQRFKCVPYCCKECGQPPKWNDKPLVLNFDHTDGDNRNHSPSNLRWLCPNCHSQTDTFCGRNIKNPKRRKRK